MALDPVRCPPPVPFLKHNIWTGPVVRLDLRTLYLKQFELIGSTMGTHEEFASLVEHIASGRIKPLLARNERLLPGCEISSAARGLSLRRPSCSAWPLAALRAVEDHPRAEVLREVLEAVGHTRPNE